MEGKILVTYKILCKTDFNLELSLEQLLSNEKIAKAKKMFKKDCIGIELVDIETFNN